MAIYVVSRSALSRDLIASYFRSEGFRLRSVHAALEELPESGPGGAAESDPDGGPHGGAHGGPDGAGANGAGADDFPTILLHVGAGETAASLGLAGFRARCPGARIVLVTTEQVSGDLGQDVLAQIDMVVSDRTSLGTLSGILTVVHHGFRVTPPPASPFAPRLASGAGEAAAPRRPGAAGALPGEPASGPRPAAARLLTLRREAPAEPAFGLSEREASVMRRLRDGASNKDIAKELQIVESTVKVHLRACYRKIGVRNRTQAAVWAVQNLPR